MLSGLPQTLCLTSAFAICRKLIGHTRLRPKAPLCWPPSHHKGLYTASLRGRWERSEMICTTDKLLPEFTACSAKTCWQLIPGSWFRESARFAKYFGASMGRWPFLLGRGSLSRAILPEGHVSQIIFAGQLLTVAPMGKWSGVAVCTERLFDRHADLPGLATQ